MTDRELLLALIGAFALVAGVTIALIRWLERRR